MPTHALPKRYVYRSFPVEYHQPFANIVLYSKAMSLWTIPLLISVGLGVAAFFAHRTMHQMHRRLLDSELAGRDYALLSDYERHVLSKIVNHKFHQSIGGKLASFVLLYAYPTLFVGGKLLGRTQWSTIEVIAGSSLIYFMVLSLVGLTTQVMLLQN